MIKPFRNLFSRLGVSRLSRVLFGLAFVTLFSPLFGSAWAADSGPLLRWGPILGLVAGDNASIKWTTRNPASCALTLGGRTIPASKGKESFHQVYLDTLTPETTYRYSIRIETDQGQSEVGPFSFRTPPAKPQTWRFVIYGDTRGNNQEPSQATNHVDHEKVVKAIESINPPPAFCIHTGDLVDRGERLDNWDKFFQIVTPLTSKMPFLPVRGNHDYDAGIFGKIFYAPLGDNGQTLNWYGFRYGNAQFVFLDTGWDGKNDVSVCAAKLSAELPFLEKVLAQATADGIKWKFVFLHIPPVTSGRYGCNDHLLKTVVPLLEEHGVTCCFSAHCHLYERSFKNGVAYVVSGGGGAPFQDPPGSKPNPFSIRGEQAHHFITVDVSSETVDFEVLSPDGETIDSFDPKSAGTGGASANQIWEPAQPKVSDVIRIVSKRPGKLHWAINGWTLPAESLWPPGSEKWTDGRAIETPMVQAEDGKKFETRLGPFQSSPSQVMEINAVFHYPDNTWGKDFRIPLNR